MPQNLKIIRPTDGQRRELKKLGYGDERIDKMSKSQARNIIGLSCQQSAKKDSYKSMSADDFLYRLRVEVATCCFVMNDKVVCKASEIQERIRDLLEELAYSDKVRYIELWLKNYGIL